MSAPFDRVAGPATTQASKATITAIELRDAGEAPTLQLVPTDTFFVDVFVRDTSGFRNVSDLEVALSLGGAAGLGLPTWQLARFQWQRGAAPAWTLTSPNAIGWRLLPDLCDVDTLSNATTPQRIRVAFSPCAVARADTSGWQAQAWTGTVTTKLVGIGMREHVEWVGLDAPGRFAAGSAGDGDLPLAEPSTGHFSFRLVHNTPVTLRGFASAFTGVTDPGVRFGGGDADTALRWIAAGLTGTTGGHLDSLGAPLGDPIPALADTTALLVGLDLRLSLSAGLPPQDYESQLLLSATSAAGAAPPWTVPLAATVLGSGLAAHAASAEVEPHRVAAGTAGAPMLARLGFAVDLGETGVNRLRVALPTGWSSPRVTAVSGPLGLPVAFDDASTAGSAIAALHATQLLAPLRVDFEATAPAGAQPAGAAFVVYFDDTTTAVPEQVAAEGNPDLVGESGWNVVVEPASAARLDVTPDAAQALVGETVELAALVSDAYGNPRPADPVSWNESGGAGSVDAGGRFAALAAGTSRVIAQSGALADTAWIGVTDPAAGVRVTTLAVPAVRLLPAGEPAELARVLVENPGALADTLDFVELDDVSLGPVSAAQREGSWSAFELRDSTGSRLAAAIWAEGRVRFERVDLPLPPAAVHRLHVHGAAAAAARDGDSLGLAVGALEPLGLRSGRPAALAGGAAPTRFAVDGMSAAQVVLEPLAQGPLFAGSRRRAIAELHVPANGYAADRLLRLNLLNRGSAEAGIDLERLEAWRDDGDHLLDTLLDRRLGALLFTGDRWELTGLSEDVPANGACLLVSADVPTGARDGRTLRLALPTLPDVGLGMESGNSGPVDRELTAGHEDVIGGGERVLATATQLEGGTAHAGQRDVPVLALVLANGYGEARRLRSLTLTNASAGAGTAAQLDGSFAHVALAHVPDAGGGAPPVLLALGSFAGGRVTFDGLDLLVPSGGELRLLVTADVDAEAATDTDVLAVSLASPQDLGFLEATTIGGTWPARSGASWRVDGFVAAQAALGTLPGLTLAPGDGPVAALDVRLPANGYLADALHGVRLVNLGDADPAEIAELRLFRDGGDGRLGGTPADDTDLGPLVAMAGHWQTAYLDDAVPVGGRRYFVGLSVASATSDSSLVRLAIPAGGVEMESGDDGPLDAMLASSVPHVLSTRPLLADLEVDPPSSTIGQQVDVRLRVRNVGTESFDGVTPGVLVPEGTAAWQLVAGPAPGPASLAPGDSLTFTWTLAPASAGELRFAATAAGTGAVTALERRTLVARTSRHVVFMESDSVRLLAFQSMPSAVNRGQAGVVPLTLTLEHPGDASSSGILFRRLRVRLEQEDGSPVVPADLASAVEVREGTTVYLRRTSLEASGDVIDLTLATPVTLRPDDPVSLSLRLDIAASTSVSTFRLVVDDSSGFAAEDAISGRPVRVRLQGQSYPVRSGLARLLSGDGALTLSAPAPVVRRASSAQANVALANWQVAHSSTQAGSADLRLNAVEVRVAWPSGMPPTMPWARWRVVANGLVVASHEAAPSDTGDVRLVLVPAPVVQPGATVALRLEADLAPSSAGASFVLDPVRTATWDVRDVNSGEAAPVVVLGTVGGDTLRVESPATQLAVAPRARMPALVAAGRTRLPVLDLVLRHPDPPGVAGVRADSVRVSLHAPDGSLLAMDDYLGTLRLSRRGTPIGTVLAPAGSDVLLPALRTVEAGEADTLTLEVDVSAGAPAGSIELRVADGAIRACDANTSEPVAVVPAPPAAWPFGSGTAQLVAPARELRASAESELPAMLAASGTASEPAARLVLLHPGPSSSGPIAVDHLVVSAADEGGAALALGAVAASLEIVLGGTTLGQSAALSADSATATIGFGSQVEIAPNDSAVFSLRLRPRAANPATRFRVGWRADGIGVVQPASALLAIAVLPAAGSSFPLWTESAGFAANDLASSYLNHPNPFAAGRDATTFVFLMPGPGRATLRIWTARGVPVVTLLDATALPAGLRQADRWDGRNGRGDVVTNGVYVAELDVTLDDGRHERVLRKVAVVR